MPNYTTPLFPSFIASYEANYLWYKVDANKNRLVATPSSAQSTDGLSFTSLSAITNPIPHLSYLLSYGAISPNDAHVATFLDGRWFYSKIEDGVVFLRKAAADFVKYITPNYTFLRSSNNFVTSLSEYTILPAAVGNIGLDFTEPSIDFSLDFRIFNPPSELDVIKLSFIDSSVSSYYQIYSLSRAGVYVITNTPSGNTSTLEFRFSFLEGAQAIVIDGTGATNSWFSYYSNVNILSITLDNTVNTETAVFRLVRTPSNYFTYYTIIPLL